MTRQGQSLELLSIGRFGRLAGLSIGALRHYDELGLLHPVQVDPETGYRRYAREQLEAARAIARLRDLEVPLEEIRELLGTDDPDERRRRLSVHRSRLDARLNRLIRVLHVIRQLSEGREPIMTSETTGATAGATAGTSADPLAETSAGVPDVVPAGAPPTIDALGLDADAHRALGKALYNRTWTLLESADRTPEQVDEMLYASHASAYHWWKGGGTVANRARSEWQLARVYSTLRRGEPALWHARRCLVLAEAAVEEGVADDWDVPAALEGLARAQAVAGDHAAAAATRGRAQAALAGIGDPEDRELIEQDLASAPV